MTKRKALLILILLMFLGQSVFADDKYKAPVPSGPDPFTSNPFTNNTIAIGKIAILPYADHISVYPLDTGDLVKGKENYFFTSAIEGQYLFTLINIDGTLVTGELLTLTVGDVTDDSSSILEDISRQTKEDFNLVTNIEVSGWWNSYSEKILKEKLRSDVIGKETTEQAKTWSNDWKKWYNKMVPVIKREAEDIPLVTSKQWSKAYLEIWEGIK